MVDNLFDICCNVLVNCFERSLVMKFDGSIIEEDLFNFKINYFFSRGEIEKVLEIYKCIFLENWDNFGLFYFYLEYFKDMINYFFFIVV